MIMTEDPGREGDDARWPAVVPRYDLATVLSELRERGAVIIRDAAGSLERFVDFTDQLMVSFQHHSVATRERDVVASQSNVATVNKGTDDIPLHRESSFLPTQPDVLAFYCEQPAAAGGQTTLCDGVRLLAGLPAQARSFIEGEVFSWRFRMPFERWSVALGTGSEEAVASRISELMTRFAPLSTYEYRFEDGFLDGTYRSPLVLPTFWGGRPAFSNSLLQYYYRAAGPLVARQLHHAEISGGRAFPADVLEVIRQCADGLTAQADWQAGDAVLVDNSHVMHGRRSFTDQRRRVLVRLGNYRRGIAGAGYLQADRAVHLAPGA
jgi:Taurine catabolism dioxygenase TauD, TfdA family